MELGTRHAIKISKNTVEMSLKYGASFHACRIQNLYLLNLYSLSISISESCSILLLLKTFIPLFLALEFQKATAVP